MSEKFEQVYYFFARGVWSELQVKNAVRKKWITADEFKKITGNDYSE